MNTDLYHIHAGEQVNIDLLRKALAVVCDDLVIEAQLRRDCRIVPVEASAGPVVAALRRTEADNNQTISVVIPSYNYSAYIGDAIVSVLTQTHPADEIIVVDDASTDDSLAIAKSFEPRVTVVQHQVNSTTASATRNTGIAAASGQFIVCLDADDMMEPTYLQTCFNAIKDDHSIGITYTGVVTLDHATRQRFIYPGWPIPFNWEWSTKRTLPPQNCIPTACMFRREMWERGGGCNESMHCGEDVDYWIRWLGLGFTALKCSEDPLFIYRRHGPSMSNSRPFDEPWAWNRCYNGFAPLAAPTGKSPVMRDYTRPAITVIIPVGPDHADLLPTAIESVLAQTMDEWEIIVVNDSGAKLPMKPYPFARVLDGQRLGVSHARNMAMQASKAPFVYFLDADDYILPTTLAKCLREYAKGKAGYIYTGWLAVNGHGTPQEMIAGEYQPQAWVSRDSKGLHGVSVLMARETALEIGGFDENITGLEDWEFFIRCAVNGQWGARVPEALLGYRLNAGKRRVESLKQRQVIVDYLGGRYADYFDGVKPIMSCCPVVKQVPVAISLVQQMKSEAYDVTDNKVMMQFIGNYAAPVTYFGKYAGCKDCKPIPVDLADVKKLEATRLWRAVQKSYAPAPEMAKIV